QGSRPGKNVHLLEHEIRDLCHKSRGIFLSQPILLEICGDIHGQFYHCCGFPPESHYLFLGDYADRGKQSLETICLLLAYKIKYPENFFLLRGSHECPSINRIYSFYDELAGPPCPRLSPTGMTHHNIKLWKTFTDCFNCLPIAAIVDEKICCCHGEQITVRGSDALKREDRENLSEYVSDHKEVFRSFQKPKEEKRTK
ncbi:unnamed protein product, partial [Caretta caretta]